MFDGAYDFPIDGGNAGGAGSGQMGGKKWKRSHGERASGKNQRYNANHLLNFKYDESPPVQPHNHRSPAVGSIGHRAGGGKSGGHHSDSAKPVDPAVAKKAFILQNFQFILTEAVAFDANVAARCITSMLNFDELPWWDYVRFVVCREGPDDHTCPICLENPRCPRITVCGHIFCFPCILRHLDYCAQKNQPKVCPVCHNLVLKPALRPVVWVPCVEPKANQKITWSLLTRNKDVCQLLAPSIGDGAAGLELAATRSSSTENASPLGGGIMQRQKSSENSNSSSRVDPLNFIQKYVPAYGDASAMFSRYCIETEGLMDMVRQTDSADLNERLLECGMDAEVLDVASAINPPKDGELSYSGSNEEEIKLIKECELWVKNKHPDQLRATGTKSGGSLSEMEKNGRAGSSGGTGGGKSAGGDGGGGSPVPAEFSAVSAPVPGMFQTCQKIAAINATSETKIYRSADGQQIYLSLLNQRMLKDAFEGESDGTVTSPENSSNNRGGVGGVGKNKTPSAAGSSKENTPHNGPQKSPPEGVSPGGTSPALLPASSSSRSGASPTSNSSGSMPASFEARILDIETVQQTPATRTNYKSLSHVPLYSSYKMCFVELKGIVPDWVMAKYKNQIDQRKKRHKALKKEKDRSDAEEKCLKEMWDEFRRDVVESGGGGFAEIPTTPDISPNTLAQMPTLDDIHGLEDDDEGAPLDLGPSAMEAGEEEQGGEVDALEDDEDEGDYVMFGVAPNGGSIAPKVWSNTSGVPSRAHMTTAGGGAQAKPSSTQKGWATTTGATSAKSAAAVTSSTKETKQSRQRKNDHLDAMEYLFDGVGGETVWTEDGEAIHFPEEEQHQYSSSSGPAVESTGGGSGGGGKGGKKGKGKQKSALTISLTGGGRR